MPRGHRIFFENAHYHIMDRGNGQHDIFLDNKDREFYLSLITAVKEEFGLLIPAFTLMTNHVHLYLVTPRANLGEAMHALNRQYAQHFNKAHDKTGHLFEDRYKYKLIQSDRYSLALARYIHVNPVKAGLAAKPEDYEWSSAGDYLGTERFPFVDKDLVLDPLGETPAARSKAYLDFMAETIPGKFWRPFDKNRNMVLGDREFKSDHSPHDTPGKSPA